MGCIAFYGTPGRSLKAQGEKQFRTGTKRSASRAFRAGGFARRNCLSHLYSRHGSWAAGPSKTKGKKLSDSPGHPEPYAKKLFDRWIVDAKRRTRVPSIAVEGTAPPNVRPAACGPLRGRPLPHVPSHVVSSFRAHSARIQAYRRRMADFALIVIGARCGHWVRPQRGIIFR